MNFSEIRDEVLNWTKRPDLLAQTNSAIRRATLAMHRKEKFWRDLATVTLTNLLPDTVQLVDVAGNFPRFRQLKYVKVVGQDIYFTPVDVDDLLDNDGYAKLNVVFLAGTSMAIKSSTPISSLEVCYYRDPVPTEGSYSSWIAELHPDLLIAAAAKQVLAFDNESEIYKAAAIAEAEEWIELIRTNLESEGR